MATPRASTLGRTESVLLDLELPGMVLRYTSGSEPISITNAAGRSLLYSPGFSRVSLERSPGSVGSGLPIQIDAPDGVSWARLRARGHRFEAMRAVVRHHYDGQTIEEAEAYEWGRVVDPSYGDESQPLTFKIERQLSASGSFPPPSHRIDDQTFAVATIDERVYGSTYPVVFGHPGLVGGSIAAPTTPAYLVLFTTDVATTNRWLIADGRVQAKGSTVTLYDIDDPSITPVALTVKEDKDLLGQWYSYVDSASWGGTTNKGNEFRVAWSTTAAGGVWNARRTAALRGAGEIMLYLLLTYAPWIRIDAGRMEAQRAFFDRYKFDIGTTKIVDAWPFILSNILPMLPADIVETSEGIYFQRRRLDATRTSIVGERLDSTPNTGNVYRTTKISGGGGDVANRITLRYGRGGTDQRYLRAVTIDATANSANTSAIASRRCAESQRLFERPGRPGSGVRPLELESKVIYDDSTARQVVQDKALELALPPELVKVSGGAELDAVDVNDAKLWNDDDLLVTDRVTVCRRKVISEDVVELTLLLIVAPFGPDRVTS